MIIVDGKEIEEYKYVRLYDRGIKSCYVESLILKELYLTRNQLTSFSAEKDSLPKLERLYLSGNQLTSFSVERDSLPNLVSLYLSGNQLMSFSVDKDSFPNLRYLHLSRNILKSFSVERDSLPNLEILYLTSNRLTTFFVENGSLPNLKELYLVDNPNLKVLIFSSRTLIRLWIQGTGIQFVDETLMGTVSDKQVQVREHILEIKDLVTKVFHQGNPIVDEIVEHLTI